MRRNRRVFPRLVRSFGARARRALGTLAFRVWEDDRGEIPFGEDNGVYPVMEACQKPLELTLLFAPGCAAAEPTERMVRTFLARRCLPAEIRVVLVKDADQAQTLRFPGSPTVRVNGRDLEPEADLAFPFGLG